MMFQQAVLVNAPVFDRFEGVPMPACSTAVRGTVSEDLFVYPVRDFSLRRGETAFYHCLLQECHIVIFTLGRSKIALTPRIVIDARRGRPTARWRKRYGIPADCETRPRYRSQQPPPSSLVAVNSPDRICAITQHPVGRRQSELTALLDNAVWWRFEINWSVRPAGISFIPLSKWLIFQVAPLPPSLIRSNKPAGNRQSSQRWRSSINNSF